MIDDNSFLLGLIIGVLLAWIAGAILGRINVARNIMRSPDKPMSVSTAKTPRDVFRAAAEASRTCFIMTLILVVFLVVAGLIVYSLIAAF